MRVSHTVMDLSELDWQGDEQWQLTRFRNNLTSIMAGVGDQVTEEGKQASLLGHCGKPELMKPEAQHFLRPHKHRDKDFSHLMCALDRVIGRGREGDQAKRKH